MKTIDLTLTNSAVLINNTILLNPWSLPTLAECSLGLVILPLCSSSFLLLGGSGLLREISSLGLLGCCYRINETGSVLAKAIVWTLPNLEGLLEVWVLCDSPSHPSDSALLFFSRKQSSDSKASQSLTSCLPFCMSSGHFTMRYVLIWAFSLIAEQFPPKATSKY